MPAFILFRSQRNAKAGKLVGLALHCSGENRSGHFLRRSSDRLIQRVDVAVSSPPLLMKRVGHRGDAFRCGALRDSARQLIELKGGTRRGCCSIDCLDLLAQVKMKTWIGERARGRKDERIIGEGVVLLLLLFVPNHFRNVPRRSTHLMIEI